MSIGEDGGWSHAGLSSGNMQCTSNEGMMKGEVGINFLFQSMFLMFLNSRYMGRACSMHERNEK